MARTLDISFTLFRIKICTITSKIIFVSLRYRVMYLKHTCLFGLVIPIVITVLISCTTTSGYSSTLDNNTVLQAAQKSLDANQKQLVSVSSEPAPSSVQWIHGDSMVQGVGLLGL
jgi:hypothetical protein